MSDTDPVKIEFPPIRPKNLIILGEDLRITTSILPPRVRDNITEECEQYLSSIFELISRGGKSPMEAATLEKTFREAVSSLSSSQLGQPMLHLWSRLYAHALLRESRIFPNIELYDKSPSYTYFRIADIWKGDYRREPVCVKVIRTRDRAPLVKIKEIYRRVSEEGKLEPHPNVLPVIEISETLFPLCIMSPWMQNGDITRYTRENPGADRFILLTQASRGLMHLHGLGIIHGNITPENILITPNGQACLGEFGITGTFLHFDSRDHQLGIIRYIAPECDPLGFQAPKRSDPSEESDVYSLALTSFSVLAGLLPKVESTPEEMREVDGELICRPARPRQNQWLQDPVWDVIVAGWHQEPKQRCTPPILYRVFLKASQQKIHTVKTGESSAPSDKTPGTRTGRQQQGSSLSRIASHLPFWRGSESKIQRSVNEIDERLENRVVPDGERLKLFNELRETCSQHRVIPRSMHIPDCSEGSVEVKHGSIVNISRGTYEGRLVAIKVLNVCMSHFVILSRFCREAVVWKHLRNPNILPLLGVTMSEHRFALVSEWMENGNINDFIKRDPSVNRAELLVDVGNGLKYMHHLCVVHGYLKGANILINGDRRACIADFGFSTITDIATHTATGASKASVIPNETLIWSTHRWMSPELLVPEWFGMPELENNRPTRGSDCYALGMVIYEVLCGHHPYLEIHSDDLVKPAIVKGTRPKKPERAKRLGFSDELWEMVGLCWKENRDARPGIEGILSCLNDAVSFWYRRDYY